jgi:serine/threonine protein kinase
MSIIETLDTSYALLDHIGEGCFAEVYKIQYKQTQKFYELKIITHSKSIQNVKRTSQGSEENILTKTHHPNILQLFDIFEEGFSLCLILEPDEIGNLMKKLNKIQRMNSMQLKFFWVKFTLELAIYIRITFYIVIQNQKYFVWFRKSS